MRMMVMMNRATAVTACGVALFAFCTVRAQVHVRKTAGTSNPTLCVTAFDGPAAIRERLEHVLRRANWFTVVDSAEGTDYRLACRYAVGPPASLDMMLTGVDGNSVRLRQATKAGDTDDVIFRAVDKIIGAAFGNPGLCTSRIAFAVGHGQRKEIFTCNFDGSSAQQITFNETISTEPSWGPGAAQLVYTLYENDATTIALVDMIGRQQRRLPRSRGLNASPALSPDGRWLALCLSRDNRVELYVMHLQTGRLQRLTNDAAVESSPSWSPDGQRICYVSDRSGRPQLYVIAAAGGRPMQLLADRTEAVSPDWSPVSGKICFSNRVGPQYVLAVIDPGDPAAGKQILTRAAGDWESPSWAPDGRHVVCSRSLDGRRGLWMVDSWYGRMTAVTQPADHSLPSWSGLLP